MTAEALSAQQGSEAQKDSLFRFLKSTLSKQMGDTTVIVSTALEELSFLLYYHSCKMVLTKNIKSKKISHLFSVVHPVKV